MQGSSEACLPKTRLKKARKIQFSRFRKKKLFINLAVFDCQSICVPTEKLKETQTTTWIGKYVPNLTSIYSNLIDETIICTTRIHRT